MSNNSNGLIVGLTMVFVFIVGFLLGNHFSSSRVNVTETAPESLEQMSDDNSAGDNGSAAVEMEGATTVDTASLTDGQRKMLNALGIDADSITITPEIVACAEAKLGAARIAEIQNGASPSFVEGTKLMACYSAN